MARGARRKRPGRRGRARVLVAAVSVAVLTVVAVALVARVLWVPEPAATDRPGSFAYYVLALSWSPTYCAAEGRARGEPQCEPGAAHDFVLHGLWPSHARGWPEYCATGEDAWVPEDTIAAMLDIMPNRGLIIHQYRKHGTCSGLDPHTYFAAARKVFEAVRIPARYRARAGDARVPPEAIVRDFATANPQLGTESVVVRCGDEGRLREIRVCLSRGLKPIACGVNEDQDRLCPLPAVVVPTAAR